MADDIEQLMSVMEDARQEGSAALAALGCELADALGVSEAGGDEYGLWCRLEVEGADGRRVDYRMRWLWPGRFVTGSAEGEAQREVALSRGFWLGETLVTRALYGAVTGVRQGDDERLVAGVSYDDCAPFCGRLSHRFPRLSLRLPTEAQREYAARAGTARGLHDMLGSVLEWCGDRTGGPHRVLRSGAFDEPAQACGFRLAGFPRSAPGRGYEASGSSRHVAILGGTRALRLEMAEHLVRTVRGSEVVSGAADQVLCARTEGSELFVWTVPHAPVEVPAGSGSWEERDDQVAVWCDVVLFCVHAEVGLAEEDLEWLDLAIGVARTRIRQVIFLLHGSEDEDLLAAAHDEAMERGRFYELLSAELGQAIPCAVRAVSEGTAWAELADDIAALSPHRTERGTMFVVDTVVDESATRTRLRGVLVAGTLSRGLTLKANASPARVVDVSPAHGGGPRSTFLELTSEGAELGASSTLWTGDRPSLRWQRQGSGELLERELQAFVRQFRSSTGVSVRGGPGRDAFCVEYEMDRNGRGFWLACTATLRPGASSIELSGLSIPIGLARLDEHTPGTHPMRAKELYRVGGNWDHREALAEPRLAEHRWRLLHYDRGIIELLQALHDVGDRCFGYADPPLLRLSPDADPGPAFWRRRGWQPRERNLWEPAAALLRARITYIGNME